jgi:hypothetical protein
MSAADHRVLVVLEPGMNRESTLRAVISLGGEAGTVIEALFVEDVTLLRVSRLPVAREITLEARERVVAPDQVETQYRVLATRLRAQLETEADRVGLRCEFRMVRGDVTTELLRAASLADVLVLAHSRIEVARALSQRLPLCDLLAKGPSVLAFVQERWSTGRRVLALFAGDQRPNALRVALAVAKREALELSILLPRDLARTGMQADIMEAIGGQAGTARFREIARVNVGELLRASIAEDARVLVLPAEQAVEDPLLVTELLKRASCSIITVR